MDDRIRVCLIDDEVSTLRAFRWEFEDCFEISTFSSGEAALYALAGGLQVDVLISDQRMPSMDGDSVLVEIKSKFPWIQRLITTAYADVEPVRRCINEAGVFGYIEKPWDIEEVRSMVQQAREAQLRQYLQAHRLQDKAQIWYQSVSRRRYEDLPRLCHMVGFPSFAAERFRQVAEIVSTPHHFDWRDAALHESSAENRFALNFLRQTEQIRVSHLPRWRERPSRLPHSSDVLGCWIALITHCRGTEGSAFQVDSHVDATEFRFDAGGPFGDTYLDPLCDQDSRTLHRNALLLVALAGLHVLNGTSRVVPHRERFIGEVLIPH